MKLAPFTMQWATVYGSLMHHRAELAALGEAAYQPPYNAPPQAPVLYIKPANTFSAFGASIALQQGYAKVRARACLGLVFKSNGIQVHANQSKFAINSGMLDVGLLCDLALPHESFHRPPVRFNAFDGSLGLPSHSMEAAALDLQSLQIETWVNGIAVHQYSSADWLTTASQHLQAVSEFIAFEAGDVLMMGSPPDAPLVQAGDVVELRMNGHTLTRNKIIEASP